MKKHHTRISAAYILSNSDFKILQARARDFFGYFGGEILG